MFFTLIRWRKTLKMPFMYFFLLKENKEFFKPKEHNFETWAWFEHFWTKSVIVRSMKMSVLMGYLRRATSQMSLHKISQHAFKSSSSFMVNMALFEACSKQFIKDTGRSTLRPILDLNTSTRCSILCVVTRKRSRWFWKADTYKSTPFTLNELLTKVRRKY